MTFRPRPIRAEECDSHFEAHRPTERKDMFIIFCLPSAVVNPCQSSEKAAIIHEAWFWF